MFINVIIFKLFMVLIDKSFILLEIKKREQEIKEKFHVKHLYLFGSYAKDSQTENSDIDILVEFEEGFLDDFSNELDLQVYFYHLFKRDIGLCERSRLREDYVPYIVNDSLVSIC